MDYPQHPLLKPEHHNSLIIQNIQFLRDHWSDMTLEMRRREEESNRIFIGATVSQDELTPDVPLNEITLTCNPSYRYGSNKNDDELESLLLTDTIKNTSLYAVGCMFGRYSLDRERVDASRAGTSIQTSTLHFPADKDNIIPVLADDDLVMISWPVLWTS